METTSFDVYLRGLDSFGMTYHTYHTNFPTIEGARDYCRQNARWTNPGGAYVIAEVKKQVTMLDGPENRFEATRVPGDGAAGIGAWDDEGDF